MNDIMLESKEGTKRYQIGIQLVPFTMKATKVVMMRRKRNFAVALRRRTYIIMLEL